MKKALSAILLLVFIGGLLVGCNSGNSKKSLDIHKVTVFSNEESNESNDDSIVGYQTKESLLLFHNVITKAGKLDGIVDIAEPEYDFEVMYKDGTTKVYRLWVGEENEKSTLMKKEDTHTIYSIPEDLTNELIDLLK